MRTIRIYHASTLDVGLEVELEAQAATHLTRVLRVAEGTQLVLFNGDGNEYQARISRIQRHRAWVAILDTQAVDRESPLDITLCQGISTGERMDYTIQKAVELGVSRIQPLFSERGSVQLKGNRLDKRLRHWRAIVCSACEQCGRNRLPLIEAPGRFDTWIAAHNSSALKLILDPNASMTLSADRLEQQQITLLVGPEGGLSPAETDISYQHGFVGIHLGPRILRTETAAVTALSIIQNLCGDLG